LLSTHIEDEELKKFYHELMVSEAGHYVTFIEVARTFQNVDLVNVRCQKWLNFEALVLKEIGNRADRMY